MLITPADIQGLPEQLQLLHDLQVEVKRLKNLLDSQPDEWLLQSEARKLFIGREGKPVARPTFNRMLKAWAKKGYMVDGRDIMTDPDGQTTFINKAFLKGQPKYSAQTEIKLRAAYVRPTAKKTA